MLLNRNLHVIVPQGICSDLHCNYIHKFTLVHSTNTGDHVGEVFCQKIQQQSAVADVYFKQSGITSSGMR